MNFLCILRLFRFELHILVGKIEDFTPQNADGDADGDTDGNTDRDTDGDRRILFFNFFEVLHNTYINNTLGILYFLYLSYALYQFLISCISHTL